MTGAGDVLPAQPDEGARAQGPAKRTETDIPPGNSAPAANAASTGDSHPSGNAAAPGGSRAQSAPAGEKSEPVEQASAAPPPAVTESSRQLKQPPAPVRRSKPPSPAPAAPSALAPDADLEATGERYLYGNGLPQNCARAESSLQTAALHGNSKAETVLGTMYATGHCVGRDLPTAYRWFARALHQEPQNNRISVDLQVLWRQMTPQEKQLAMSSGH